MLYDLSLCTNCIDSVEFLYENIFVLRNFVVKKLNIVKMELNISPGLLSPATYEREKKVEERVINGNEGV